MYGMFYLASSMDGDLSNWDVSEVSDFRFMFHLATIFNGDISNWDVSNATSLEGMFRNAMFFDRNLGNWNVSGITDLTDVFSLAFSFTGDSLENWDVGNVQVMRRAFASANAFNGNISNWDVSSVTVMDEAFVGATAFNQNISGWNVSSVRTMSGIFLGATSFNQNLGNWDISAVTDMTNMFSILNPNSIVQQGMSVSNYDSTLIGWQQNPHQLNVNLGADNLLYCLGDGARTLLIADGWNFIGDSLNCQTVGLEKFEEDRLMVYPNPSSGIIKIRNANTNSIIRVHSLDGKVVFRGKANNGELNLTSLSRGIYIADVDNKRVKLSLTD
jgi:surface protein